MKWGGASASSSTMVMRERHKRYTQLVAFAHLKVGNNFPRCFATTTALTALLNKVRGIRVAHVLLAGTQWSISSHSQLRHAEHRPFERSSYCRLSVSPCACGVLRSRSRMLPRGRRSGGGGRSTAHHPHRVLVFRPRYQLACSRSPLRFLSSTLKGIVTCTWLR